MEMVSAALPSASFKLLGVMPYAAKPSPVSTSLREQKEEVAGVGASSIGIRPGKQTLNTKA